MKRAGKTEETARPDGAAHLRRRRLPHFGDLHDRRTVVIRCLQRPPSLRPPKPFIPDITERSGLLMRFAATPEMLPPDPHRDFFYNTRYADNGRVKHPNWVCTQGLYGLGWKTPDTQSVYPYYYGMPGQNTIDSSSRPWFRPAAILPGSCSSLPPRRVEYYSIRHLRAHLRS